MNSFDRNSKRSMLDFTQLERLARESGAIIRTCIWALVSKSENGQDTHRTTLSSKELTVGRRPNNELCLTDPTVSGWHAKLQVVGPDLIVTDLNSTNGTLINGVRLHGSERLREGDILNFGQTTFFVECSIDVSTPSGQFQEKTCVASIPEDAVLYKGFDQLLNKPDINPHFQPVVQLQNFETIGYEVLVRSEVKGLEYPDRIFKIAAMRLSENRLSEVCRSEGLSVAQRLSQNTSYFLNTHASELETPRLIESLYELRAAFPGSNIVLEIHEAAITSVKYLLELSDHLQDLNIDLAYDDFGSGQARLIELFEVPPRYLKFDLSFVRGLENASKLHRASVRALLNMVRDLDVLSLAEGVETQAQADICVELGFDAAQGYFFGRPQPVEHWRELLLSGTTQELMQLSPAAGIFYPIDAG